MKEKKIVADFLSIDARIVMLILLQALTFTKWKNLLNHSLQRTRNAINLLTLTYNLKGVLLDKTKFLFVFHHLTPSLYTL